MTTMTEAVFNTEVSPNHKYVFVEMYDHTYLYVPSNREEDHRVFDIPGDAYLDKETCRDLILAVSGIGSLALKYVKEYDTNTKEWLKDKGLGIDQRILLGNL